MHSFFLFLTIVPSQPPPALAALWPSIAPYQNLKAGEGQAIDQVQIMPASIFSFALLENCF